MSCVDPIKFELDGTNFYVSVHTDRQPAETLVEITPPATIRTVDSAGIPKDYRFEEHRLVVNGGGFEEMEFFKCEL